MNLNTPTAGQSTRQQSKSAPNPPLSGPLLDLIVVFLTRFIVFVNDHQAVAVALWVLHTHTFAACESTPYLLVTSPEPRSGKSRLLEVLELLVAKPWPVSSVSEAVLFRKIHHSVPTVLFDEVDATFASSSEKTEPIRGVINSGSRRGGKSSRCVGPNHEVQDFSTFSPKCLASIDNGRLPETVRDRSILIRLHRRLAEKIEKFRFRVVKKESEALVAEISTWAEANVDRLEALFPNLPDDLNDRAAEGWEPLLAIAELAGPDWSARATAASLHLSADSDVEDDSFGVQLLADLKRAWKRDEGTTVFSRDLCDRLNSINDGPWKGWGRARKTPGFTERDLARTLRPFGIKPKTVRIGESTAKGYHYEQFEETWARYVPDLAEDEEADR